MKITMELKKGKGEFPWKTSIKRENKILFRGQSKRLEDAEYNLWYQMMVDAREMCGMLRLEARQRGEL